MDNLKKKLHYYFNIELFTFIAMSMQCTILS